MKNFLQITPFMWVPNLADALRFLVDGLGFRIGFRSDIYAYVEREGVAIRVCVASDTPGEYSPGTRAFRYYIDVTDVLQVLAEIAPKLKAIGHPGILGPVDQAYGQREIMVIAPDGDLVVYGQAINAPPVG